MSKILFINACVRENSRTLELSKHVLSKLQGDVEEVKLFDLNVLPLDKESLEIRENAAITKDYSSDAFNHAKQFANAEIIVVGAPYWDLMFPAVLKNYFERVTVSGLTFSYGQNGIPKGHCKGKKLIYVTTSGGPIKFNFGYDYVAAIAKGFYGINDVSLVKAEGLDIYGADVFKILNDAKNSFKV